MNRMRPLAWGLYGLTLALVAASAVFLVLGLDAAEPEGAFGFPGFSSVYALAFGTVGLLIATRRPSHPIGWMLLSSGGLLAAFQQLAQQYAVLSVLGGRDLPAGEIAAWLQDWIWIPQFGALTVALLLIPDGRLPSPGWRPVVGIAVVANAVALAMRLLRPGPIESFRQVENPLGAVAAADVIRVLYAAAIVVSIATAAAAAVSVALRRRGARGAERAQVRWVAFGGLLAVFVFVAYYVVYLIQETGPAVDVMEVAFVASVITFAFTLGIAILRFRLFEIDVVVTKTVVIGLLAAFITLVYVALVVGVGALVGSGGDVLLSAVAAALVALAFQPVRRSAHRVANRLVFGERASPFEVLSEFSERVAGAYGADDVVERMARILGEGVGADRAEVWLRVGPRLERAASWPAATDDAAPVPLAAGELPGFAGASLAIPVRHDGGLLGALVVRRPPTDPVTPTEERVVSLLAHQAGLVLRNAALIADLRASRQRLVAAQDEERRRLERNLHDGAQQQLVALSVKLGLLKRALGEGPARLEAQIDELRGEAQDALENLRDLARGIYPPLLADRGLTAALEAQARKAPLPVTVDAAGVNRHAQTVEAAVYFACLEALQNVAKYARASRACVRIADVNGTVVFEVEDDGIGFDIDTAWETGSGLQGIRDRLAALGGHLEIRSAPGSGTTLTGRIPVG